jgi:hypothetical protein
MLISYANSHTKFCGHHSDMDANLGFIDTSSDGDFLSFLDSDWEQIRIHLDYTMLNAQKAPAVIEQNVKKMMEESIRVFSSLFNVKPIRGLLKARNPSCSGITLGRDVQNGVAADLVIVPFVENDHAGSTTVAAASACDIDQKNFRPLLGRIGFNPDQLHFTDKASFDYYIMVTLHELSHIFGFSRNLFEFFIDSNGRRLGIQNVVTEQVVNGRLVTMIKTPKVIEAAKKHFNCPFVKGVEVENQGGSGTAGSHWEARIMLGDYMIGDTYEDMVMSEITLALFEDSGWYKVNYFTGGLFRFGKNAGCEFLNNKCVENGKTLFPNDFCATERQGFCTSGRFAKGFCEVSTYSDSLPSEWQYFSNPSKGGRQSADFCPVATTFTANGNNKFHNCKDGEAYYPQQFGLAEEMGSNSSCFMSSLTPTQFPSDFKRFIWQNPPKGKTFPICYKFSCDIPSRQLFVTVKGNKITCPRQGGDVKVPGFDGTLRCPDFNLVCTSDVYCDNAVDCAEKRVLKLDPVYDYVPNNSQQTSDVSIITNNFGI